MAKARIIIEVREDNKVYVTGPLDDKTLCLAMLDEAKETVKGWNRTRISIPTIIQDNGTTRIQGG